jgi:hypothetical protein
MKKRHLISCIRNIAELLDFKLRKRILIMRYLKFVLALFLMAQTANAQCEGNIKFVIDPLFATPSTLVQPSASELRNCEGTDVFFRENSCSNPDFLSSCELSSGECVGYPFNTPSTSGAYTYYACAQGKETSLVYMVGYSSLPDFNWSGIVQIFLIASIALLFLIKRENRYEKIKN